MTKIKVIGAGGSGSNAISRMSSCKLRGVDLIAVNTDLQDLKKTKADLRIQIGREATKGLGAGMDAELGKKSAEEQREEIKKALKGTDMLFITGGFGGGTCTGSAPVIADIAKSLNILTIAIITTPFKFEGLPRMRLAKKGLEKIKNKVDTLIVIPNEKILSLSDENTSLLSAFWACDDILREAVQTISDLITVPGIINVDFADLKSILNSSGRAFFGQGKAKGEKRIEKAVNKAINSPLVGFLSHGAKGILFNISGGSDLSLAEINRAARAITKNVRDDAKIIFGAVYGKNIKKGEVRVMVIATGFKNCG
jgi:cell division protein FtsZ